MDTQKALIKSLLSVVFPDIREAARQDLETVLRMERDNALENAAIAAEGTFGRARTYASENADRYHIQDETTALVARRIRALKALQ